MTPREFVLHWHSAARLAPPRFVPDSWLRQADALMKLGVTATDLTLVANWMRSELGRSQENQRTAIAFNGASFLWVKMFGEFGASNQHERFVAFLTQAEASRPRRTVPARPVHAAGTAPAASPEEIARVKAVNDEAIRKFHVAMQGGPQP